MILNYFRINPGGNITAIVKGEFSYEDRIKISKSILKVDSMVEQVGFWMTPLRANARARLEMMGGGILWECNPFTRVFGLATKWWTRTIFY